MRALHRLAIGPMKKNAATAGWYADGGGLYWRVAEAAPDADGTKRFTQSWVFRYMLEGRPRYMGLGSANDVTLAEARDLAREQRKLLQQGRDPIEVRDEAHTKLRLERARSATFKWCAQSYIKAHKNAWRSSVHIGQWGATLTTYAYPIIGHLPVQDVDTSLVMKVLEPLWTTKTETASRLRGRIEKILGWATTSGYRQGDNPARWQGHLMNLLPQPGKVQKVEHHRALPYSDIGEFMAELRNEEGIAARALVFAILTATRTSETIGATWQEIDIAQKLWIIPADRIKAGKEHRVPLSDAAIAILKDLRKLAPPKDNSPVFPGLKGKPLSNMAMLKLLHRMGRSDITVHGFRSTFRDFAAERTNYPREVAEMALAHAIPDRVEAAYRRGDLFEKRTRLMNEWSRYCATRKQTSAHGKVTPIVRRATAAEN